MKFLIIASLLTVTSLSVAAGTSPLEANGYESNDGRSSPGTFNSPKGVSTYDSPVITPEIQAEEEATGVKVKDMNTSVNPVPEDTTLQTGPQAEEEKPLDYSTKPKKKTTQPKR